MCLGRMHVRKSMKTDEIPEIISIDRPVVNSDKVGTLNTATPIVTLEEISDAYEEDDTNQEDIEDFIR